MSRGALRQLWAQPACHERGCPRPSFGLRCPCAGTRWPGQASVQTAASGLPTAPLPVSSPEALRAAPWSGPRSRGSLAALAPECVTLSLQASWQALGALSPRILQQPAGSHAARPWLSRVLVTWLQWPGSWCCENPVHAPAACGSVGPPAAGVGSACSVEVSLLPSHWRCVVFCAECVCQRFQASSHVARDELVSSGLLPTLGRRVCSQLTLQHLPGWWPRAEPVPRHQGPRWPVHSLACLPEPDLCWAGRAGLTASPAFSFLGQPRRRSLRAAAVPCVCRRPQPPLHAIRTCPNGQSVQRTRW